MEEGKDKEEDKADIKLSNNPHLTGGEQQKIRNAYLPCDVFSDSGIQPSSSFRIGKYESNPRRPKPRSPNITGYPWTPKTHGKMKVFNPQYMGEITPKNEGCTWVPMVF